MLNYFCHLPQFLQILLSKALGELWKCLRELGNEFSSSCKECNCICGKVFWFFPVSHSNFSASFSPKISCWVFFLAISHLLVMLDKFCGTILCWGCGMVQISTTREGTGDGILFPAWRDFNRTSVYWIRLWFKKWSLHWRQKNLIFNWVFLIHKWIFFLVVPELFSDWDISLKKLIKSALLVHEGTLLQRTEVKPRGKSPLSRNGVCRVWGGVLGEF